MLMVASRGWGVAVLRESLLWKYEKRETRNVNYKLQLLRNGNGKMNVDVDGMGI
jgi:hypothetical protein